MVRKLRILKNTNGVTTQQICKYRKLEIGSEKCHKCRGYLGTRKSPQSPLFDLVLCDYPVYRYRSADNGRFLKREVAEQMDPRTWIKEKIL